MIITKYNVREVVRHVSNWLFHLSLNAHENIFIVNPQPCPSPEDGLWCFQNSELKCFGEDSPGYSTPDSDIHLVDFHFLLQNWRTGQDEF